MMLADGHTSAVIRLHASPAYQLHSTPNRLANGESYTLTDRVFTLEFCVTYHGDGDEFHECIIRSLVNIFLLIPQGP